MSDFEINIIALILGEIRVAWHPEGNEEVLNENRVSENI